MIFCVIPDEHNSHSLPAQTVSEELILQIAADDLSALEKLYLQTSSAVYGYLLAILKNQQDAEDLMQETYIKVKTGAHLYEPSGKPLAWIFVIARNLAYMKLRREKLYAFSDYQELENTLDFSAVEDKENRLLLEAAFTILDDRERQIIVLHANTGMKHREIAVLLQIPLSTVLSKYRRSLKKLRNYIEGKVS